VSVQLQPALAPHELPDPETLSGLQLTEQHCALCNARLYRDRFLGKVTYVDGDQAVTADLWGCDPDCRISVSRRRRSS
jgi:hypothetical protein